MATPTDLLTELWRRQSADRTAGGAAKPALTAEIRQGRFSRRYAAWSGPEIKGRIAGGNNGAPWQAFWTPSSAYMPLPNVLSFRKDKDFSNNGITTATIELENVVYDELGSGETLVHLMRRGALSPYRGFNPPGRPSWPDGVQDATWYRYLERNAQITVYEGYGDETVKSWTGLIDDIDLTAKPDRITVTARDFGQALSDQEMFGWNHDPLIKEPVTFIDKKQAEKLVKVGYDAEAGTSSDHHPPSFVLDLDGSTYWRSRTYNTYAATDYIQIRIPQGRYETFYLWPKDEGMEAYISLYVKPRDDGKPNVWGEDAIADNGWIDMDGNMGGTPHVPGALGGVPYVKKLDYLDAKGHYHVLPKALECGKGSIIRVSFRNLAPQAAGGMPGEDVPTPYAARVTRMVAMKRNLTKTAKEKHQVLIEDVSDAVRFILRWAGFKEWNIEDTGVRLQKPVAIGRDSSLMDAINKFRESVNFVFFMSDPSADDLSIGIPTFRSPRVLTEDDPITEVSEVDLLTGIRVKISDAPLAYVIRMRGRATKDDEPTAGTGFLFGGGDVRRVKFTYYPPWARGDNGRLAGLLKHVLHQDNKFKTAEDCEFACYYTAMQEALESVTGTIEVPGYPGFELDSFVMVYDTATGLRSRLWVSNLSSEFTTGEESSYKVTLSGSWVDTPDVVAMKEVINAKVRSNE